MKDIVLNIVIDKAQREVVDKIVIDFNILKSISKPLCKIGKEKRRYIDTNKLDNLLLDGGVAMTYKVQYSTTKRDGILYEYPYKIILISDQKVNAPELKEQSGGGMQDTLYIMSLIYNVLNKR